MKPKQAVAIVEICSTLAPFDYSALAPDIAEAMRADAARIRGRLKASVIETGRDLLAAKERLEPHGQFHEWIACEFNMTVRTAQNYMQAARVFGDKGEIVSRLPQALVYQLAAPATPAPIREEIVKRIESGEHIYAESIQSALRQARKAARSAAEGQRTRKMNDDKRAAFLATLPEEERARLSKKEQRFELEQRRRRAQQDREDAERKAEEAAADAAAAEAINMVRVALGPEFSKFIELAQKADRTWREWIRNGGEKPEREEIWLPAKAGVELPEPSPFTSSPRVARSRSAWPSS